jgi:cytochrome c
MKIAAAALLLTSTLVTTAHAEGESKRGEARFQECAACHKLEAGANEVGPSLHGIFSQGR